MSLLEKLRNKQNPTATPAPAPVVEAPKADVQSEVAKLEADERAIKMFAPLVVGECPKCKQEVTKENGSRTPSGRVVHTVGCSAASPILPPDAPESTAPNSAMAIPEGTVLSPVVAEAAKAFEGSQGQPTTVATLGTVKPESTREPYTLPNGEPIAQPKKTRAKKAESTNEPASADGGLQLYVDCFVDGVEVSSLDRYLVETHESICKTFGVHDIRVALDKQSPLAFGGWKGVLAAAIRNNPPTSNAYTLTDVRESEIKQVACEVLKPLCAVFVRAAR